jgi:hypothetical protein
MELMSAMAIFRQQSGGQHLSPVHVFRFNFMPLGYYRLRVLFDIQTIIL